MTEQLQVLDRMSSATVSPLVTVVLPAYNEAAALPTILSEMFATLDDSYEVIVVDDGSTDLTPAIAGEFPCVLLRHAMNRGKGAALRTGILSARGSYIVIMDADATYPVSAIPSIIAMLKDYDIVRCQRQNGKEHMPLINRLGNWVFDALLTGAHGLNGKDYLSGLYGLRRETLLSMDLEADGFDVEAEIGIKARARGLQLAALPITYQPRLGEKKLQPGRDGLRILGRILFMLLLYRPALTFMTPGAIVMLLGLAGALLLRQGPLVTPYFGLSIHSFILASLGVLAGFQLIVFGLAAALYGVEAHSQAPRWLIFAGSHTVRLSAGAIGLVFAGSAFLQIMVLIAGWFSHGAGAFEETRSLVLSATLLVWGLQILSGTLFLSIFAGRLERKKPSGRVIQ